MLTGKDTMSIREQLSTTNYELRTKITPFSRKVYQAVLEIPLGHVRTYQWVAQRIGHPKAYRAVGQALKNNPYPLVIPCHRVVASGGELGGYVWGEKTKKALLDLERQIKDLML
jgi:O-6-methylguanine DNA methyltransferase